MLIRVSLNTIGLNRIGLNRIGKPSRGSSERPYIDPEVLASLKAVCICYGKSNDDPDRAVVKNLVDPDNPFVISNAAYTEGSGYADKGSPYYGAFVTDGIDDLITATKTVQEMLGGSNEITVVSMIHKMSSDANWSNQIGELKENHTFVANRVINTDKTGIYGYTYDGSKDAVVINNILGDEKDYTCRTAISLGLNNKYYVTGFENVGTIQGVLQVAWYWTFIANKVLTTDQINQVIAYFNLDRTLKPDILCNTIKQGITNENHAEFGDKLIDFSDNGRDIQLNNIAWKGDSGIGKYATDFTSWLNKPTETSHSKSILEAGNVLRTKSATSSMKVKVQFDKEIRLFGKSYGGKELYDVLDSYVRKGFFALDENERQDGKDIMWYIWLHPDSPLFGKDKMATFERYFLQDAETHIEKKNPYYSLLENEKVINQILEEFGLDPAVSHIVNGHVPVKRKDGENPVKCGGKVLVIDGGFSKAYQKETGIAGYTLIFNSYGLLLVAHEPFESTESAIAKEKDIHSETMIVKRVRERLLVGDTDIGEELKRQVKDLERLLVAYRNGELREKR